MIYVGIDVAKNKHNCIILDSSCNVLTEPFIIQNNLSGFNKLYQAISNLSKDLSKVKVGLEATGHYHDNILDFICKSNLTVYLVNPLKIRFFGKALSLRETKTDNIDCRIVAEYVISNNNLKPYFPISYHMEELKSLTRYRLSRVHDRSRLKVSVSRLVTTLFPELKDCVSTLHLSSIYAILKEFPGATYVADAHLTKLTNILEKESKGQFGRDKAIQIRELAKNSIASDKPSKSFELKNTIRNISGLDKEIKEIDAQIKEFMDLIDTPILSIPGISINSAASIIAEIGDFNKFESADKILAYAGMTATVYESGQLVSNHSKNEKRGSKYLRYALFYATTLVCVYDPNFRRHLAKKRSEGKHYYVAVTHAAKKLVRLMVALVRSGELYRVAA